MGLLPKQRAVRAPARLLVRQLSYLVLRQLRILLLRHLQFKHQFYNCACSNHNCASKIKVNALYFCCLVPDITCRSSRRRASMFSLPLCIVSLAWLLCWRVERWTRLCEISAASWIGMSTYFVLIPNKNKIITSRLRSVETCWNTKGTICTIST